jgi:branched-chain amino acid transport system ATP-binding protein
MLEMSNINAYYGKAQALWDISLSIEEGEIVALVGSNGAGKTTLLKTLSGVLRPASGTVTFFGQRIDGLAPHSIVAMGICHVPEGRRLFAQMSVGENLEMGAYAREAWKRREETLDQVFKIFPVLKERQGQLASTLSGGEQQMVAMGRGLMSRPRLCLFDEPSYGLAPMLVTEIFRVIQDLREQGMTVLLVEQNVRQSLEIADRACVLENGRIALAGECEALLEEELVKKAYLGL